MIKTVAFALLAATALFSGGVDAQNAAVEAQQLTLPNWVGPRVGKPIDSACYRKAFRAKRTKKCPRGYDFDKMLTCWAQCPIEYPVECGPQCLPQNADCTTEVLRKVGSVANVALNAATSGVFGKLSKASKGVQKGVECGQQLFDAVNKVVGYVDEVQSGAVAANTTQDQVMFLVSKSEFATRDLPIAVSACLGVPPPARLDEVNEVTEKVKAILDLLMETTDGRPQDLLTNPAVFISFMTKVGLNAVARRLSTSDMTFLNQLVEMGKTCGPKIKTVIEKTIAAVQDIKKVDPNSPVDVIRLAVMNSEVLLTDLPDAVTSCVTGNEPDSFSVRDQIMKMVYVLIDRVVEAGSQDGKPLSAEQYALVVADMGLEALSIIDPTGLAAMAKEFVQPICIPTALVGAIDDGPADQALGLNAVQKAFRGSEGQWTRRGDGVVKITFRSVDDKDVKVNIKSGGDPVDHVSVKSGTTVVWTKPIASLQGKTMYMDRWRPGFLGMSGTGGGSLLLWVPETTTGGHLDLNVQLNPTPFGDHTL